MFDSDDRFVGSVRHESPLTFLRGTFGLLPGGLFASGEAYEGRSPVLVSLSGKRVGAFRGGDAVPPGTIRAVAIEDSAHFWTGPIENGRYELVRWNASGAKTIVLRREDAWIEEARASAPSSSMPTFSVTGLSVGATGVLYVSVVTTPPIDRASGISIEEVAEVRLEVLDRRTGQLLAVFGPVRGREAVFGYPLPFNATDLAAVRRELPDGRIDYDIVRMQLRRSSR